MPSFLKVSRGNGDNYMENVSEILKFVGREKMENKCLNTRAPYPICSLWHTYTMCVCVWVGVWVWVCVERERERCPCGLIKLHFRFPKDRYSYSYRCFGDCGFPLLFSLCTLIQSAIFLVDLSNFISKLTRTNKETYTSHITVLKINSY